MHDALEPRAIEGDHRVRPKAVAREQVTHPLQVSGALLSDGSGE